MAYHVPGTYKDVAYLCAWDTAQVQVRIMKNLVVVFAIVALVVYCSGIKLQPAPELSKSVRDIWSDCSESTLLHVLLHCSFAIGFDVLSL